MIVSLDKEVVVGASLDEAWSLLVDPYRLVAALPGAEITERVDDRTYSGTVTVTVGPIPATYSGTLRFEQVNSDARIFEVDARGKESGGRGGAGMRMSGALSTDSDGRSRVTIHSEVEVTGFYTQFGASAIREVSDAVLQRFAEAVRTQLEKNVPDRTQPLDLLAVGAGAARAGIGPVLRQWWPWAILFLLLLLVALIV